ncbi:hypothetical protein TNCV_3220671 [Trichonephila clavipes]|nr:hypothetical protein TNCV_3220671 [Trichonephila clavipes]
MYLSVRLGVSPHEPHDAETRRRSFISFLRKISWRCRLERRSVFRLECLRLYPGNRRVIIRGDAFRCKTQFILRVLSSALGGIRALPRKSESGKERERWMLAWMLAMYKETGLGLIPPSSIWYLVGLVLRPGGWW